MKNLFVGLCLTSLTLLTACGGDGSSAEANKQMAAQQENELLNLVASMSKEIKDADELLKGDTTLDLDSSEKQDALSLAGYSKFEDFENKDKLPAQGFLQAVALTSIHLKSEGGNFSYWYSDWMSRRALVRHYGSDVKQLHQDLEALVGKEGLYQARLEAANKELARIDASLQKANAAAVEAPYILEANLTTREQARAAEMVRLDNEVSRQSETTRALAALQLKEVQNGSLDASDLASKNSFQASLDASNQRILALQDSLSKEWDAIQSERAGLTAHTKRYNAYRNKLDSINKPRAKIEKERSKAEELFNFYRGSFSAIEKLMDETGSVALKVSGLELDEEQKDLKEKQAHYTKVLKTLKQLDDLEKDLKK